ncbi:MAG: hypothetical protein QCI82_09190 [Candidatus Thermoplasmatota archaeon]|nr:hypothetical protein [Candidatus Thermoplasmatota archaeon]
MKKIAIIAIVIGGLVLAGGGFLLGANRGSISIFDPSGSGKDSIECPEWEIGMFWTFTYQTPAIQPTTAKMVVATKNSTQYQLGMDSRLDAQRHAVLNYNPFIGRITVDNLAVSEKGVMQNFFSFPLQRGKTWTFSFFDREQWDAKVVSIVDNPLSEGDHVLVNIEASSGTGDSLTYNYDSSVGWYRSLTLKDSAGNVEISMALVEGGSGYKGDLHYVRGRDLFKKDYTSSTGSPTIDFYDSFIDRGHPTWGPFDRLIYFYEVQTGSQSNGLLTIRDHSTTTVLRKVYDPGISESSLGSMRSSGGEVGITVALQGSCGLKLMVAGGIEYTWRI